MVHVLGLKFNVYLFVGVDTVDSGRLEGCTNGSDATKVQNKGYQDARDCDYFVCVVVVAAVFYFCALEIG